MANVKFCCPFCRTECFEMDRRQLAVHGLAMSMDDGKRMLKKGSKLVRLWCTPAKESLLPQVEGFVAPPQGLKVQRTGPKQTVNSIDWDAVRAGLGAE